MTRPRFRSSSWLALSLAALVVSLGGCTGQPLASPEASPSPSLSPVQSRERPAPFMEGGCSSLISDATLQTAVDGVVLVESGTGAPSEMTSAAALHAGGLHCGWASRAVFEGSEVILRVTVAPAATELYVSERRPFVESHEGTVLDAFGEQSDHSCRSTPQSTSCEANIIEGGRWIEVILIEATATLQPELPSNFESLLREVTGSVAAAPASTPWAGPSGSFEGSDVCLTEFEATASEVFGRAGVMASAEDGPVGPAQIMLAEQANRCLWFSDNDGEAQALIEILPGGAWVFDDYAHTPPTLGGGVGDYRPVEVAGADAAWAIGSDSGDSVMVEYENAWVHLYMWDVADNLPDAIIVMEKFLAALDELS